MYYSSLIQEREVKMKRDLTQFNTEVDEEKVKKFHITHLSGEIKEECNTDLLQLNNKKAVLSNKLETFNFLWEVSEDTWNNALI